VILWFVDIVKPLEHGLEGRRKMLSVTQCLPRGWDGFFWSDSFMDPWLIFLKIMLKLLHFSETISIPKL